ncbi:protein asteroid [Penaeus vannamei]|nr:protein asteroid-like [Penaeus vannamei]
MGIRGLHSYVLEHASKTLEWHKLHNRNLIIDGNNLAHFLYDECSGINAYFGGDYDKYANFIQKFFEGLQKCNVKVIVVMDGGQPVDGSKWVTVQTRLQMQLSMCLRASPSIAKFKIFPPMGRQVFVTTLRSMDITILQTDFEADMEIAVLAKNLGYTVLSNDSDFIVCDVPLIRLESMNYKNVVTETDKKTGETINYIPCFLFNREEFCTNAGINKEHLPLFGTLLSNDYIPLGAFSSFYLQLQSEIQRPGHKKMRKGKFGDFTEGHRRIVNLLSFLSRHASKPLKKITNIVTSQYFNNRLRREVNSCVESYANLDASKSNLFSALPESIISEASLEEVGKKGKIMQTELRLKNGNRPPNWFVEAYRTQRIPHEVSDILTKGDFISPPQVEMKELRSSYLVAERIVRSVYTVLWKGLPLEAQEYDSEEESSEFDNSSQDGTDVTLLDSDGEEGNKEASDEEEEEENETISKEEGKEEINMIADEEEEEMVSEEANSPPSQQSKTQAEGHGSSQNRGLKRTNQEVMKKSKTQATHINKRRKQTTSDKKGRAVQRKHLRWFIRNDDRLWIKNVYFLGKQSANLLPSLDDVEKMSLYEKKIAFYRMLNLESRFQHLELPDDLELILDFILFWFENSSIDLADIHGIAALICIIQYYIIDGKNGRVRTKKRFEEAPAAQERVQKLKKNPDYSRQNASVIELLYYMSHDECLVAGSNLFNFHHMRKNMSAQEFNIRTVHAFSEFQACVYFMQLVNSLLCFPFPLLSIEFLWGGTFSYNIFHHLKRCGDPVVWTRQTLGMGTCLERLFVKLYSAVSKKHKLPILRGKKRKASKREKRRRGINLKEENVLVSTKQEKKENPLTQLDNRFEGLEIDGMEISI